MKGILVAGMNHVVLCRFLRAGGFVVLNPKDAGDREYYFATSADALVDCVQKLTPDAVFLNILLGRGTDVSVMVDEGILGIYLVTHLPRPPIVVALACESYFEAALCAGPDSVIKMPMCYAQLPGMLKEVLSAREAIAA
jgi:hypothetical protein